MSKQIKRWWITLTLVIFLFHSTPIEAAPYFFLDGPLEMNGGYLYHYNVYLYTDLDVVTAAQTVLNFDSNKIKKLTINTIGTRCNFWAPADPSLGYPNTVTPYFHDDNKLVIACGFSNPGYRSLNNSADLIAKIQVTPLASVSAVQSLSEMNFTGTAFRYIGSVVNPGEDRGLTLTVYQSTAAANPTATPYPSPTPVTAQTITAADLNLISYGASGSSTTGVNQARLTPTQALNQISQTMGDGDNIPPPPELSPRPTTPVVENPDETNLADTVGEVLSIQSLKELLLPGRSQADQTVVLINLISALAFIAILAILIWRLIVLSRMNNIKYRHLKDLLSGELSALESKLASEVDDEGKVTINQEIEEIKTKLGAD